MRPDRHFAGRRARELRDRARMSNSRDRRLFRVRVTKTTQRGFGAPRLRAFSRTHPYVRIFADERVDPRARLSVEFPRPSANEFPGEYQQGIRRRRPREPAHTRQRGSGGEERLGLVARQAPGLDRHQIDYVRLAVSKARPLEALRLEAE